MRFYTYLWLRTDGTPYYIGKGCGKRAFDPIRGSIHKPEDNSRIVIEQYWPTEAEALAREIFLIALYGRKDLGTGCLRNLTRGGDGLVEPSLQTRLKMSRSATGKIQSAESRRKKSDSMKKLIDTGWKVPHWNHSLTTIEQISKKLLGRKHTQEHRANAGKAIKKAWQNQATKDRHSLSAKNQWKDPDFLERFKRAVSTPKYREQHREATRLATLAWWAKRKAEAA